MLQALALGAASSKNKYVGISTLLIVIAVIAIVFIVLNKVFGGINGVLESFGLKDTKEEKELNKDIRDALTDSSNPNSPFSPSMYKSAPAGAKIFSVSTAQSLAKQIYDSVGVIWDDPESGFGAIKQCKTQSQVSFLSDTFNNVYGKDLISWLDQKYDRTGQKKVLREIYSYVANLPKYN